MPLRSLKTCILIAWGGALIAGGCCVKPDSENKGATGSGNVQRNDSSSQSEGSLLKVSCSSIRLTRDEFVDADFEITNNTPATIHVSHFSLLSLLHSVVLETADGQRTSLFEEDAVVIASPPEVDLIPIEPRNAVTLSTRSCFRVIRELRGHPLPHPSKLRASAKLPCVVEGRHLMVQVSVP